MKEALASSATTGGESLHQTCERDSALGQKAHRPSFSVSAPRTLGSLEMVGRDTDELNALSQVGSRSSCAIDLEAMTAIP